MREKVKEFINAEYSHEIIFTSGATEAINLVADSFGRKFVSDSDEIVITLMEHHSNIVPWQLLCERVGATLKVVPLNEQNELDLNAIAKLLNKRTRLLAVSHISNVIGVINPINEIIRMAHAQGVPVLIDGAQATSHMPVDVKALDCDFYVFSGHKMYAPMGVGVLYGKTKWLEKMPPYQSGGAMISQVAFERTLYNQLPYKFEAGTPNVSSIIGLGAAIDYLQQWPIHEIHEYESQLLQYAITRLREVEGLKIIGDAPKKSALVSFVLPHIHAHDIGTILDHEGVAVRAGHHCAMPLMHHYKVPATVRVSLGLYNTVDEIDLLMNGLEKAKRLFG